MSSHHDHAFAPLLRSHLRAEAVPGVILAPAAVLLFVALTAIAAQIRIPLPGGVPITLQTLAVALAALTLGPRLGSLAMALYLALGLVGVPVFTGWGAGPTVVMGATGGYLVAFLLAQPVINLIGRTPAPTPWRTTLAVVAGHLVIFGLGVPWYAATTGAELGPALTNGFLVFLPGLLLKSLVAGLPGPALVRWSRRRGW